MLENRYRYALEFFRSDGVLLDRLPVDMDWEPALECARFQTVRRGAATDAAYSAPATVQPVWSEASGEPYVHGFTVTLKLRDAPPSSFAFTRSYFQELASGCKSRFEAAGKAAKGETLQYVVVAFPESRPNGGADSTWGFEELPPEIPIRNTLDSPSSGEARAAGPPHPDDLPSYIPAFVLEEIAIQARRAGELETGGFLIGYLCRDVRSTDLFVSITGQLPAEHTRAESTRLTFTPATWTAAQSKLKLRNRGEMFLGWFHSHPSFSWCSQCPAEDRQRCPTSKDFFSAHDRLMHRTAFPHAYSLAVVANVTGDAADPDVTFSSFGWRDGMVQLRRIHIISNEGIPVFSGESHVAINARGN